MRIYYAHCLAIYGTPQEDRDVALLEALGFEVVNPNSPEINQRCARLRQEFVDGHWKKFGYEEATALLMDQVFRPLATTRTDALFFRGLPDGSIPAGVAQEVEWARAHGNPVVELPSAIKRRVLTVAETREYLTEVGQR